MNRSHYLFLAGAVLGTSLLVSPADAQTAAPAAAAASKLDYEFFKARVQPIFIKRRSPDYSRCYACHEKSRHKGFGLTLEKLEPGKTEWTEEQTRKNFQMAARLVVPGNVALSVLLIHPLAPEKGGDAIRLHSGGRQFPSMDDPDWQILSQWVKGATLSDSGSAASQAPTSTAVGPNARQVDGRLAFEQCELCHNVRGPERKIGPSLQGLFRRAKLMNGKEVNEENVRAFIKSGGAAMPPYADVLTETELNAIVGYLKTI